MAGRALALLVCRWVVISKNPFKCVNPSFHFSGEPSRATTLFLPPASTFFEETKNVVNYQLVLLFSVEVLP